MKHGTIAMVGSTPSIRIRDASESKLYNIRAKSLRTGKVYEKELARIETDGKGVHICMFGFDEGEDIIFTLNEITDNELEAWFVSDDETGFRQWRQDATVEEPSAEGTVPDVDHGQDDQDHEPVPEPDVTQNEPDNDHGLTTLQYQILTELKVNGRGSVADLLGRMGMASASMQAVVRKNLHILMQGGHIDKTTEVGPNGRPVQIWGVM